MNAPAQLLTIRPADAGDAPALWALLEPVLREGETYCLPRDIGREEALEYWCGPPHAVFLAAGEDGPLGTYYLTPNQRGGGAHVCNCGFVTAAGAQGRGVARAMLAHALDAGRAAGYHAMQFNFVIESNQRAVETWARGGFAVVGRIPDAFAHPRLGLVDALVMHRRL